MLILAYLKKLVAILNDKASPKQIAGAVAIGAIIGLLPGFSLLSLFIFIVLFLVNVNLSAAFFSIALFKPIGFILDPIAHRLGLFFLVDLPFLKPIWTALYNIPFIPFSRFNNTVVMGSLIIGIILWIPIFILVQRGIIVYRERWLKKVEQFKIMKILKATSLFNFLSGSSNS